ncbi:MAG: BBP7 family outer membrane beta-barrel protein [Gemmataceae bacterium]
MRRQFKVAFGGWLAATAAALAQMPPQQPAAMQPVRYVTPFGTHNGDSNTGRPANTQYVAVQPAGSGTAQSPITVQYVPVQSMGNGQYVAVQPVAGNSNGSASAAYIPVQPSVSGTLPPTNQTLTNDSAPMQQSTSMSQSQAPTMTPVPSTPSQTTVQYVPVQQGQYVPVQPGAPTNGSITSTPMIQYVPVQSSGGPPAPGNARPAVAQQQGAAPQPNQGCPTGNCPNGACNGSCPNGACGSPACGACQAPTCNTCPQCGPSDKVWASGEYLLWWTRSFQVPNLGISAPAGTPVAAVCANGTPLCDDGLNDGIRSGFRLRLGAWLDCCHSCGIEASYLFLADEGDSFSDGPSNSHIIARPFHNAATDRDDCQLINVPGTVPGSTNIVSGNFNVDSNTSFTGFDVNVRKNLRHDCCNRADWIVGFRYWKLDDELTVSEDVRVTGVDPNTTSLPVGTRFQIFDNIHTRNEFYGAQLGLVGEHHRGQAFMNWRAAVAMGTTHKDVYIDGQTTITQPSGAAASYAGGILALPTNMGHYSKNDFAVVPEFNINVGYEVSENLRVFVGYSFVYWSNVTRPGDVIDTSVNPTQFPPGQLAGASRPTFTWHDSDFWAQGFNFGAELKY